MITARDRDAPGLAIQNYGLDELARVVHSVDGLNESGRRERTGMVVDGPEQLRRLTSKRRRLEVLTKILGALLNDLDRDIRVVGHEAVGETLDELESAIRLAFLGPELERNRPADFGCRFLLLTSHQDRCDDQYEWH